MRTASTLKWPEHVARHRGRLAGANTAGGLVAALNAALDEFGVSHLWVSSPAAIRIREAGNQGGLGCKTVPVEEGRLVTAVIRAGPAARAGLRQGDVITAVDGKQVTQGYSTRGPNGTKRRLAVSRGNELLELEAEIGEHPRADPATLEWHADVAIIRVPSFSRSLYQDRPLYKQVVIEKLFDDAASAKGIVIDVRSNGGGYYLFPEHLAGMFMAPDTDTYYLLHVEEHQAFLDGGGAPNASLLQMAKKSGQVVRPMRVSGQQPTSLPIVVLTDGRSGSAGETFPAMVQAAGRGQVIGTRTVGAVLGGNHYLLPGGYELFYPQAESVMPDGSRIEGNGVIPDIELTPQQAADDDFIYRLAAERLNAKPGK